MENQDPVTIKECGCKVYVSDKTIPFLGNMSICRETKTVLCDNCRKLREELEKIDKYTEPIVCTECDTVIGYATFEDDFEDEFGFMPESICINCKKKHS